LGARPQHHLRTEPAPDAPILGSPRRQALLKAGFAASLTVAIIAGAACGGGGPRPDHIAVPSYGFDRPIDVERPTGVAVSPDGRTLYVACAQGVLAFDDTGNPKNEWNAADDSTPLYVAVTVAGDVLTTDSNHRRLRRFSPQGEYLGEIQGPRDWSPLGVSTTEFGTVVVTDVGPDGHRVVVLDSAGGLIRDVRGQNNSSVAFEYPNQAVLRNGLLYVSDGGNGRIQVLTESGSFLYNIDGLEDPRGLEVDSRGLLFVACRGTNDVVILRTGTSAAKFVARLEAPGQTGGFDGPTGVALDSRGKLYVADTGQNRVIVWTVTP
jgi:sugar lactone lactonase YvrE